LSALALVALTIAFGVAGGPSRAAANPSGASPEVYAAGGDVEGLQLGAVEAGGAPEHVDVTQTSLEEQEGFVFGPVAINANATLMVVGGNFIDDPPPQWQLVNARTGALVGTFHPQAGFAVAVAMDPVNPSLAYAIEQTDSGAYEVNQLDLSTLSDTVLVTQLAPAGTPAPDLTSIAISPDGTTIYVGGIVQETEGVIYSVRIGDVHAIAEWHTPAIGEGVHDLQVAPNGRAVYATIAVRGTRVHFNFDAELVGVRVPLPATATVFTPVAFSSQGNSTPLAVSPNGATIYVASNTADSGPATVKSYSSATGALTRTAGLPIDDEDGNGVLGIAVTPDGSHLIASGVNAPASGDFASVLYPIRLPSLAVGAGTVLTQMTNTGELYEGNQDLAITPDQAPTANFSVSIAQAGHATTFDAGASSVAYGSVTNFAWNFGDGQTASTGSPAISHTFAHAGAYNVTVTETDSAGTSIPPAVGNTGFAVDGPGQTPYRRASPSARTSQTVVIPSTPPPPTTAAPHKAGAPTLTLNPAIGPPGTIVTVTGSGFKASTPVTISWSVSTGSVVVTPDALGNLPATQMFILTPDVLGPRFAVASSTPAVEAPFLVVPGTMQPGGDDASLLFRSEGS
jgi:hypothetical protein